MNEKIKQLWYEMYPDGNHETVCGYNTDDKEIVVFRNKETGLNTHVYLYNEKLMPYFPKKEE